MTQFEYPFAALVGQEPLKTALLLCAVDLGLGGVLISGEKGTAKSTAARALAELLPCIERVQGCPFQCGHDSLWSDCPHCQTLAERPLERTPVPFVDLPLGATEDRVLGSLDFQRALREGRRAFQPGLLATAHRGILYIDEVNLLPDHLVDVLLDVAAMGINIVQREGIEVRHPSRFILIGTMNPEEGELRPQFLDRFGLMVTVEGPREPELRGEIVRRRLAFEGNADRFAAQWADDKTQLRSQIVAARGRLATVAHDDSMVTLISRLCCEMHVAGMRADIVLLKTARALAAWHGRAVVDVADVRAAAELVLPHRRRRRPFEKPGLDSQQLDDLFKDAGSPPSQPQADANRGGTFPTCQEHTFTATQPHAIRRIELAEKPKLATPQGRRNLAAVAGRGPLVRAMADPTAVDVAIGATLKAAVQRGPGPNGGITVLPEDLHRKERAARTGTLLLFVVDGSGSMAPRRRMEAVKGAVLGLLQSAYEQRDHVAVICFRGPHAEVLLPPTRSVEAAEAALRTMPTGGRTPLAHAFVLSQELVDKMRHAQPGLPALLILLTDGKANVVVPGSAGDPWQQAIEAASRLAGVAGLVFDTETGMVRSGRPKMLAEALGAEYLALEELSAENLLLKVREKIPLAV